MTLSKTTLHEVRLAVNMAVISIMDMLIMILDAK